MIIEKCLEIGALPVHGIEAPFNPAVGPLRAQELQLLNELNPFSRKRFGELGFGEWGASRAFRGPSGGTNHKRGLWRRPIVSLRQLAGDLLSDLQNLKWNTSLAEKVVEVRVKPTPHPISSTWSQPIASDRCLETYLREIDEVPLLNAEREVHLGRLVQKGDEEAREEMIRANLRLVVSVAKRFRNRGLTLPDLIAEGNLGLLKGIEKFDPEAGFRFSTYATWWIQQTIRRALINSVKNVRVPSYMVEILTKWNRVSVEIENDNGHRPSPREVAEKIGISKKNTKVVQQTLRGQEAAPSLGSEGMHSVSGQHREHNRDCKTPDEIVMHEDSLATLRDILEIIDPLEASVLRMRYGLDDQDPATLEAVSAELGVSRERVRQIESHTLRKLHAYVVQGASPERILPFSGRRAGGVGKTGQHRNAQ